MLEQEEELARRIMRADALVEAQRVFEDLDEDALRVRDKWATIYLLAEAVTAANEDVDPCKEELGLPTE